MFVHWKETNLRKGPDCVLRAVLVVNKRGHKVKQRLTKSLGGIRASQIEILGARIAFWERIGGTLDGLSLHPDLRKSVEHELDEKVPKPTEEEKERNRIRANEVRQMLRQLAQNHRSSSRCVRTPRRRAPKWFQAWTLVSR